MGVVTWTPVCTSIGILNLIIFAFQYLMGQENQSSWIWLAFQSDHPEIYQYLTSVFLHNDWFHLTANAFALFAFGCPLEKSSGKGTFLIIYIVSGIGGNLLFQMFNTNAIGIGASGAIFGIICSMAFIHPKAWVVVPGAPLPVPIALFTLFYIGNEIYRLHEGGTNISHIAHIGGGLFGAITGSILTKKKSSSSSESVA